MATNRKVYIAIGRDYKTNVTYVSDVFTTKKKAEEHCSFMSRIMKEAYPEDDRAYWVYDTRLL